MSEAVELLVWWSRNGMCDLVETVQKLQLDACKLAPGQACYRGGHTARPATSACERVFFKEYEPYEPCKVKG